MVDLLYKENLERIRKEMKNQDIVINLKQKFTAEELAAIVYKACDKYGDVANVILSLLKRADYNPLNDIIIEEIQKEFYLS